MNYRLIDFKLRGDERGSLIAIEGNRDVPFDIKRVYYIFGTQKGVPRGFHAHKQLEQILVAVSGSCKVSLDNGVEKEVFELNNPDKALYVGTNLWREMYDFSEDCVLLVLASQIYNPEEYIRDYQEFLNEVK